MMLGGVPIADVEAALSSALSASLRVPVHERPEFIARFLTAAADGQPVPALPEPPSEKPPALDDEIAELNEMVRTAVNCAARHPDQPLRRIADHMLRQGQSTHGLKLAGDEEEEATAAELAAAYSAALSAAEAAASAPSPERPANAPNPVQKVLAARRAARDVPVLGKTPSAVLPNVIGALKEETAKRAAREVDERIIAQAMKAGSKTEGMQPESTPASRNQR